MYSPVCGMAQIKDPLNLIARVAHEVAAAGFLFHYLSGPLPHIQHHVTVNKMCWGHHKTSKTASVLTWIETNKVQKERYLMRQDNDFSLIVSSYHYNLNKYFTYLFL